MTVLQRALILDAVCSGQSSDVVSLRKDMVQGNLAAAGRSTATGCRDTQQTLMLTNCSYLSSWDNSRSCTGWVCLQADSVCWYVQQRLPSLNVSWALAFVLAWPGFEPVSALWVLCFGRSAAATVTAASQQQLH